MSECSFHFLNSALNKKFFDDENLCLLFCCELLMTYIFEVRKSMILNVRVRMKLLLLVLLVVVVSWLLFMARRVGCRLMLRLLRIKDFLKIRIRELCVTSTIHTLSLLHMKKFQQKL